METAKTPLQIIDTSTEVSLQEKTFLVHGSQKIPIHAECASKYSLFFRYLKNPYLRKSDKPVNLLIQNNGNSVELGPCRVLSGHNLNGYAGRIVFLQDVYDLEKLFSKNKLVKLQAPLQKLPGVLARKKTIRPLFVEYTADLTYDLSVFKNSYDDLDSQYRNEPEEVRKIIQGTLLKTEEDRFSSFLDDKLTELSETVVDYSVEEHQCHGFYFRKQLWNYLLCCPLIGRSNLKPRGYPGDSEMMRMIYLNDYQGESTFSKLMQKHAVAHPAAQSVRNRIQLIADLIERLGYGSHTTPKSKLKLLSVGCGPAFELQEILKLPQDCKNYHFSLLDQDPLALSEVATSIEGIEKKFKQKIEVDFLNYSVRTMFFSRKLKEKLGQFPLIYSMGLFDYFATPVAKAILKSLYRLLLPGGRMIIGNFHTSNPSRYYMEYWCDWFLIHRTEEEFLSLIDDCPGADASVFFENTGSQMFLDIRKPENEI